MVSLGKDLPPVSPAQVKHSAVLTLRHAADLLVEDRLNELEQMTDVIIEEDGKVTGAFIDFSKSLPANNTYQGDYCSLGDVINIIRHGEKI